MNQIIRADTDQLRAVARQMRTTAEQITGGHDGMQQSMGALDVTWSGRARERGMARWAEIAPRYRPSADGLIQMADGLEALAQRLDDAAALFGAGGAEGNSVGVTTIITPLTPDQIRDLLLKQFGDLGNIALKLITAFGSLLHDPLYLWDLLKDLGSLATILSPAEIFQLATNQDRLFDILGNATKYFDPVIDQFWSSILPQSASGSSETLRFHVGGDVTFPGIELGIPGSPKFLGASDASITKNPDGTYTFTLTDQGGVGIDESVGGGGYLTVNDTTLGARAEASAEVNVKGTTEVSFKFDPNVPGDMTKMTAFMGALGVSSNMFPGIPATASPTLVALKDNIQSIRTGVDAEGRVSADANALLNAAGVEGYVEAGTGISLTKSEETGHWESSRYVELGGGGSAKLQTKDLGFNLEGEGKLSLEQVTDMDTGRESAKVTVELKADAGYEIKSDNLKKFLPEGAQASIKDDGYGKITIEYILDEPADSVSKTLTNSISEGRLDLKPIIDNSQIEVKTAVGTEARVAAGGDVSLPSQKLGLSAEGTMTRESEVTLFKHPE